MIKEFALRWPVIRQILHRGDGTGAEAMSERTQTLRPKNDGFPAARSVCPYCAVGCGQLIFHEGNRLISIEGDPASPISRGRLCPKGSASYELLTHSQRLTKVKYRRPFSKQWEEIDLNRAMEMIADSKAMVSLEIVEINPVIDLHNKTALLGVEMVLSALGKKIL